MPKPPYPSLHPLLILYIALTGALYAPLVPIQLAAAILCLYWLPGAAFVHAAAWGRDWNRLGRFILAVAVSIVLVPLALNPVWHVTSDARLPCSAIAAISILILLRRGARPLDAEPPQRPLFRTRTAAYAFSGTVVWVAASVLFSYWPSDVGGGPIPQTGVHDYIKHHAILLELEHTLPLGNPFFADGAREPVYYYHFFYLAPAALRSVTGGVISIAFAFGLAAALVAGAFVAMAYVFIKRMTDSDAAAVLAALLAGPIGGFDILPLVVQQKFVVTLDAWADTPLRVHNLLTQLVWTPQNSQGLLLALVGAYGLSARGIFWRGWIITAPLLASSLLGTSIWLAAMLLPGAAIVVAWQIVRRPARAALKWKRLGGAAGIALLTVALSLPMLAGYLKTAERHGKSLTLRWEEHTKNAVVGTWVRPGMTANLLDLPWILFLEFGPLLVLPLLLPREAWRRANSDAGTALLMMTSVIALVAFAGVRSHFTYNDFGHRAIMIPLLTGALLGSLIACQSGAVRPRRKWITLASLLLGLPVGLWQAPATAARRFIEYPQTVAAKESGAVRFLRDATPRDAVVQGACDESPLTRGSRLTLCQRIDRQIGVTELQEDTHVFQGRDASLQMQTLAEFRSILEHPASAADRHATLRRHGVTHVLIGLAEREKWPAPATFDDPAFFGRVFDDGTASVIELR